MKKTNTYRIEKLGTYWHLMRLHYKGWWIFKVPEWRSEFPYSSRREDMVEMFNQKLLIDFDVKLK